MKKNSIFRLVLLAAATFSLHSCRTEDELIQTPQETVNRFQVFTSRNGEPVNYPRGYKILLERYDSIYSSAYTKKAFLKNNILGKSVSEEYVELTIRSQELMMKDGNERWILYPVAKGKEVIGIEAGILKNKESELEFWRMDTQGAYYKEIIDLFRLAYSKKILSDQAMSKGGNCGFIGEEPCDTGEVIIHVPHPNGPKGDPNLYLPGQGGGGSDPGVIGGDCGVYGNCGDGGSGENPNNSNDADPCEKSKKIGKNDKTKDLFEGLKTKVNSTKEFGQILKESGGQINSTSVEGESGTGGIDFSISEQIDGVIHSHYSGLLSIFSPADLASLSVIYAKGKIKDINTFIMD
ncbi:hypothetical protein [Chryseobacterium luteum]|uniref:Uncharacterized protein n=1 Tax=Chryseobacterium luteum TaxID=421531 RepID=A0A085YYV6_9FLAO|nr:hypothetical protein [Chryseobacterium luteum]KFE97369.1 hypothetical protein IX38_20500 [Chryseobacterium luteum]